MSTIVSKSVTDTLDGSVTLWKACVYRKGISIKSFVIFKKDIHKQVAKDTSCRFLKDCFFMNYS